MPLRKPGPHRSTIADVARIAGVSKTTVSRVLNDSELVTGPTRDAVEAAMREAGYTASWQARTLASGRSDAIALIVTEPFDEMWSDPTFATILHGVYDALAATELMPVLLQASSPREQAKVRRLLDQRVVDGAVHLTPYVDEGLLERLAESRIPTVLCGRLPGDPYDGLFSTVYADDEVGAALAGRHIRQRGRSRPAVLLGPADNPATADRLRGYRRSLGESLADDQVLHGGWDEHSGAAMTAELLDRGTAVDALLCASDRIAAGALAVLRSRGVAVPDEVAVIGFDDHPLAERTTPTLTTVAQPMEGEGATAVDLVQRLIHSAAPRTVVLPMELIERGSA